MNLLFDFSSLLNCSQNILDLDEEENEKEQNRCDERIHEIESGFYILKEMLVTYW